MIQFFSKKQRSDSSLKKLVDSQSERLEPGLTTDELLALKSLAGFLLNTRTDFPGSRHLKAFLRNRAAEFDLDGPKEPFPSAATIIDNDKTESVAGDEKTTDEDLTEFDKFSESFPASALEEEIPHDPFKPEDVQSTFDDDEITTVTPSVRSLTPSLATPDAFEDRVYENCVIDGTNGPFVINHFSHLERDPFTHLRATAFSGAKINCQWIWHS